MRCFWDERQRAHAPTSEFFNGILNPAAEHPGRVDSILAAIGATEAPADFGEAALLQVHSREYLDFLKAAYADWRALGRSGDAIPYTFPVTGRRIRRLERIDARLGLHSYDTSTPIAEGTWTASYWAAQTALTGLQAVLGGERNAFALCRPPGHHCGADYAGGYCYLANAAIAAEAAVRSGRRRIAILDIDYHHGNGSQDIFYGRADVLFTSIHADPSTDYPFFWGHADEGGEGEGEGANLNLPLARGATLAEFEPALDRALERIEVFGPQLLIVSYGADTYAGDPISHFKLQTGDYARLARRIASAGWPTLIVMEGGYAVDALGANVASFLSGF
jgi:acetoin utilization deacetylase AcuC-like enzyme